jgi:hypothetical protein
MLTNESDNVVGQIIEASKKGLSRRRFLGYVGASSALLVTVASCKKSTDNTSAGVNLGSGDPGILNYAYALEQLEAAFYIQVIARLLISQM